MIYKARVFSLHLFYIWRTRFALIDCLTERSGSVKSYRRVMKRNVLWNFILAVHHLSVTDSYGSQCTFVYLHSSTDFLHDEELYNPFNYMHFFRDGCS